MLSETFITSIRAEQRTANTAISKDIGIYTHSLHPTHTIKSTFKKSSTHPNCLEVSSTHIFAAQAGKAVVHVYSRDRGNQEALISFPERIHCLCLVNDGLLALGTAEGRVIMWELCTGRQVSTPTSHLQPVTCLRATSQHLISGSEDSNIHVWSIPTLMSLTTVGVLQPLRSLSNHRAAITSLAAGKSSSNTNICISASKDNTCVIWDYQSGDLLRTLLLPVTPLCLALDPCDRVVYVGFEDATIQAIELFKPSAAVNSLYDDDLRSTPIQIAHEPLGGAPADIGVPDCLDLSYDGMTLLSGHQSGKVIQWDAGAKKFATELADLNAPVNNLKILSPFEDKRMVRAVNVVKPRLGESSHTFTGQFTSTLESDSFQDKVCSPGFSTEMLESAIMEFSSPATSVAADAQLRKENEELWKVVNEQRQLQKRTFDKYREAVS